jgi:hypothetical protein
MVRMKANRCRRFQCPKGMLQSLLPVDMLRVSRAPGMGRPLDCRDRVRETYRRRASCNWHDCSCCRRCKEAGTGAAYASCLCRRSKIGTFALQPRWQRLLSFLWGSNSPSASCCNARRPTVNQLVSKSCTVHLNGGTDGEGIPVHSCS